MNGDPAKGHFDCTDGERAAFELGIKLGAMFHQYMGIPLDSGNVGVVERAIEESVKVQPFVEDCRVAIEREGLRDDRRDTYGYTTLSPERFSAEVVIRYGGARARGVVEYVEALGYPLMSIKEIKRVDTNE